MNVISAKELCLRIKSEVTENQIESVDNNLKLRILDYFISHNPSDDVFEQALKVRLSDPDPAKEQSKIICAQILDAWQNRKGAL
jgi:hypothetical protein